MRNLTALVFPWFTFLSIGRIKQARISMAMQLTVVGWIPAAVWAMHASRKNARSTNHLNAAITAARERRQSYLPVEMDSQ